ncbi:MAG: hypothetical protein HY056_11735 [Proteobacteria bacterium]|nr:hypothetical protein [Pseudomonadota bacterium]
MSARARPHQAPAPTAGLALTLVICTVGPGSLAADLEFGRYLAAECMTCHRSATATSTIPNIFGLGRQHVAAVLMAYRDKTLPNAVMQNIAGRLSDEEIASLALYFSITMKP